MTYTGYRVASPHSGGMGFMRWCGPAPAPERKATAQGECDEADGAAALELKRALSNASARSTSVFYIATAVNRVLLDGGGPYRVSGAFLSECDEVASQRSARALGAPTRTRLLAGAPGLPQPAGLAETILDYVQFGSGAVDGETASTLVNLRRLAVTPDAEAAGYAEAAGAEAPSCPRCCDECCGGLDPGFAFLTLIGTGMALTVLFALSYAASLPFAPTHLEQRCKNGYSPARRGLACDTYSETVHDVSWRSMGIGLGIVLGCLATVVGCAALCCLAYSRSG